MTPQVGQIPSHGHVYVPPHFFYRLDSPIAHKFHHWIPVEGEEIEENRQLEATPIGDH